LTGKYGEGIAGESELQKSGVTISVQSMLDKWESIVLVIWNGVLRSPRERLEMKIDQKDSEQNQSAGVRRSHRGGMNKTGQARLWRMRLMISLVLLVIIYLAGPRITNLEIERRDASDVPNELSMLDSYLTKSEAQYADIVAGTEKLIRWQPGRDGEQTEFSVVYLHGFSGSHPTLAPAMDMVADGLGAHLFCTRYAGHGRKEPDGFGKAMGEASLQDWVDDTVEALTMGRMLGKKMVVIANSTAAPIVSWLAAQGDQPDFFIMWSPNFGVKDGKGEVLLRPWGKQLLALKPGDTYRYAPENIYGEDHVKYATTFYPDKAFPTLMAAIKLGRDTDLGKVACPTLCLYSKRDEVVSPEKIQTYFGEFGHPGKQLIEIMKVTHREHHVLAGDLMSPESTDEVVDATLKFIREELARGK
jgi:alpha-beta hydrolase superfamily lysophospholipase